MRQILAQDQRLVRIALVGMAAAAWLFLLLGAGMDMDHGGMSLTEPMAMPWSAGYAGAVLVMWAVMMVAMMLPSAMPMILLFDTIGRRRREKGEAATGTSAFVGGYLAMWLLFSIAATLLQYGLEQALVMSMSMRTTSPLLAGTILVGAGIYQQTPLKHTCLSRCRSPFDFIVNRWRKGSWGAFMMGCEHGIHCLGCCWVLMLLLLVGGIMNLLWIAALSLYVLAEKLLPASAGLARLTGVALIGWGAGTILFN